MGQVKVNMNMGKVGESTNKLKMTLEKDNILQKLERGYYPKVDQ